MGCPVSHAAGFVNGGSPPGTPNRLSMRSSAIPSPSLGAAAASAAGSKNASGSGMSGSSGAGPGLEPVGGSPRQAPPPPSHLHQELIYQKLPADIAKR
jgi:hypothetical protein